MQQLSLFGGEGPLGQLVADLGLLKTSKSMWAGNIGTMVGDLTDIFGSMNLAYELEDLSQLTGERARGFLVAPIKDEFIEFQRITIGQLNSTFGDYVPNSAVEVKAEQGSAGGPNLPTGRELFEILERGGALDDPPPALKQVARIGWSPFSYFYREWDQSIDKQIREFRSTLRPIFRQFGTEGLRFERLEASLLEAIEYRQSLLLQRIPARLEVIFQREFSAAVEGLPESPTPADIEAWFSSDAWLRDFILLMYRALTAVQQFRLERLSAMIEAACHFEGS